MYKHFFKRLLDVTLSGMAIIILSPLFLLIAVIARLQMGSPVLFFQERVGKDEKVFRMCKFRSMNDKRDENGRFLPDSQRVNGFGSFLRSSSLDELPEIFLIFSGKMSIIGPRPLPPEYLPYYTAHERVRHTVRGGLVSPEVLYGDINPTWDNQLQYEINYVENLTFWMDIKIFFATFKGVFTRYKTSYGVADRQRLDEERKDFVYAKQEENI